MNHDVSFLARLVGVVLAILLVITFIIVSTDDKEQKQDPVIERSYEPVEQPSVGNDILCIDPATGHVYSCFIREDGNVQLRINPEGNLVIAYMLEDNDFVQQVIAEAKEE